jgi:hypothetical protein
MAGNKVRLIGRPSTSPASLGHNEMPAGF